MSQAVLDRLIEAMMQTLTMVGVSASVAFVIGIPVAVLMVVTSPAGISPAPRFYWAVTLIIDAVRSTPFIVMLVLLIPVTRFVLGSAIGVAAAIVPLTIGITPYFARITEISIRGVDRGLIEAADSMGFSRWHIVRHVLIPEAAPGIVSGMVVAIVALFNTSAMAGALGAGGLGDLAVRYGYQRYALSVIVYVVLILFVLVTTIQRSGDMLVRHMRRMR